MANRYAVASGNWSNTATWDGGTLPGVGDVVRPNGYTVTIDQDVNVLGLYNDASAPAVAGGRFEVSNVVTERSITLAQNLTAGTLGGLLRISATTGVVNVVTPYVIGKASSSGQWIALEITGTCTINLQASVYPTATNSYAVRSITISSAAILNVTGDVAGSDGGSGSGQDGIYILGTGGSTVTVNGLVRAGDTSSVGSTCRGIYAAAGATIIVNGNVEAGANRGSAIMAGTGASIITVNGNLIGGGGSSNSIEAASAAAGSTVTVNGNISAGNSYAIEAAGISTVMTEGDITASAVAPAIGENPVGLGAVFIIGSGVVYSNGTSWMPAIEGRKWIIKQGAVVSFALQDDSGYPGVGQTIYITNLLSGMPVPSDVRAGTTYGEGGGITGTLAVPAPSSVAAGVATDNTVGTAVLTADTLWNHEVSTGVAAKDRLLATSTVDSTGAQIAAATDAP